MRSICWWTLSTPIWTRESESRPAPELGDRTRAPDAAAPSRPSERKRILRRFLRRKTAVLGLFLVTAIVMTGTFASLVGPYPAETIVGGINENPSPAHLLGTDRLGRDLLSRLLLGARVSLVVGFTAQAISVL